MSLFKIHIRAGNPAVYTPDCLIANPNDSVSWTNDDKVAHWPTPNAAKPKTWMDYQIAPDGESSQISMNPPAPYTLNYVCSLHPGEKGQIKVVPVKSKTKKGPYGRKTKKGAYGRRTKKGAYGRKTKKGAFGGKTR